MSTVADAARPVGAPASPVRHGLCRLTLRIGGTDYTLKPCPPEANVLAAWSLRKLDPHASARYVVAAPKGKPAHCTCPDHERSGWTCKHLGALLALGLIPAPKPATAKAKRLHAKNARLAIAEAKAVPKEARQHLAEIAPPAPAPSLPEGWQPGGDYARSPPASGKPSAPTSPASAAAATRSAMGAGSTSTRTRPAIPPSAMAAPGMVLHEHFTTQSC